MIDVSDVFKQNINQFGKEIAVRITYDNVVIINNDIKSLSFTKKDDMFKSSMRSIDIVLQGNVDLRNKELSIDFGVSFEESDYNYIHFGKFISLADSIKYSYEKNETSMTCYDKLIDTHVAYDLNLNVSQNGIVVDELLQAICNRFSFTFINSTYVNKTSIISKENYDLLLSMKSTFRDVLDYLAQITASLIIVEDSELKLIYPQQSGFVFDGSNLKTLTVSDRLGPFNRVSFTRTEIKNITDEDGETSEEEQEVTYYREDEVSIHDNGKSEITFNNNPLISDVHLTPIFKKIQGLMYYSYDITSFGFCYFSPLDIVTIQYAGYEYSSMIMNDIITINNGLSESLYAEKESSSADNYIATSSSEKSVNYSSSIHKEIYSEKFKGLYANFQKVDTDILNVKEQLTALSGKIDNLDVGNLEATYAKIDLSNVGTEYVDNLFAKSGVFEKVTGEEGILYELTSVKFNGDLIKANTIVADSLVLTGLDGLYYRMNAEGGHLTEEQLSNEVYQKYLDGTNIVANSVTADKMNVNKLSALTSNLGDITGGSININDKFMVDNFGNMRAMNGEFNGVINATSGEMNNIYIGDENNNFLINKNGINGVNYIKVESEKSGNKSTLAESRGKYIQTTFDTNHYIIYTSEAFDGHFNCESKRFYEDTDTEFYNLIKSGEYTVSNVNIGEFCLYFKNINDSADGIKIDLLQNNLRFGNVRFELNPTGRSTGSGTTEGRKYITLITGIRLEVYLPKNFLENETDSNADISDILFKIFKKLGIIDDNYILSSYSRQISIKILKEDPDKNVHIGTDYISLGQGFYMTGTGKNSHIGNWYFDEDGWFVSYLPTSSEVPEQYVTLSNSLLEFKSTNKLTQIGANDIVLTDTSTGGTTTISNTRIFIDGTGFEIGNYTNKIYYNCANDGGIEIYNGYVDFHCQTGNDFDMRVAVFDANNMTIYGGNLVMNNGAIYLPNDVGLWSKNSSGTNKIVTGVSSGGNVYLGGSDAANATGNTNIYAGDHICFYANRLSNSYKASGIDLFREQSGSYRTVFRPASDNGAYAGTASFRWNTVFSTNGVKTSSDIKQKDIIKDFDFKVQDFIMGLEPIAFRRTGEGNTGKRIHLGLGAQDVNKLIKDIKLGDMSLVQACIVGDEEEKPYFGEDIDDSKLVWSLNYGELIAPVILMEQDHEYRIQQLEKENMYLRQVLRDNNLLGGTI